MHPEMNDARVWASFRVGGQSPRMQSASAFHLYASGLLDSERIDDSPHVIRLAALDTSRSRISDIDENAAGREPPFTQQCASVRPTAREAGASVDLDRYRSFAVELRLSNEL